MRKFSSKENEFIKELVNSAKANNAYLAINMFNDIFYAGGISFDYNTSNLSFIFSNNQMPNHDYILRVYNSILERVMLLKYLEKEGFIYLIPMAATVNSLYVIGTTKQKNQQEIQYQIDNSISKFLYRLMNQPMYVGETLKTYVNNGFKSLDELAYDEAQKQTVLAQKSLRTACIGLLLSIISVLISLMFSLYNTYKYSSQQSNGLSGYADYSSNNITIPLTGILGIMKNSIEPKLETTMNNTAEIKAKLSDTLNVRIQNCKNVVNNNTTNNHTTNNNLNRYPHPIKTNRKQEQDCVKNVKINTCIDTIVPKNKVK